MKPIFRVITILIIIVFFTYNKQILNDKSDNNEGVVVAEYLALGDSYTIGESVDIEQRWPAQLFEQLKASGKDLVSVQYIAKTGWTSSDLLSAVRSSETYPPYELVSLLIGVNNQYKGIDFSVFRSDFRVLLENAIVLASNNKDRVIVLSIPDWGYTPTGSLNKIKISADIDTYNNYINAICSQMNVTYIYVTDVTRRGLSQPELVARDRLHPSGLAYKEFSEKAFLAIQNSFNE